jgi:hypothetical protein
MSVNLYELFQRELDTYGGLRTVGNNIIEYRTVLAGANAATAANFQQVAMFTHATGQVLSIHASYTTQSTSGTLQIEKRADGIAEASGSNLLTTPIDLAVAGNINKTIAGSLVATSAVNLVYGDRIGLIDAGTLTNLANLIVQIKIKVTAF